MGKLVIHFAGGATEQMPLRFGEELGAAFSSSRVQPQSTNSAIAWENEVPGFFRHQTLYRTTWENPRPQGELAMLDYESAVAAFGPFLLAVTVEP